jgi:hypothetical protein
MRIRHAHASLESVRHSMWRQRWGDASARVHSPRRWLLVCAGFPACLGPLLAAQGAQDIFVAPCAAARGGRRDRKNDGGEVFVLGRRYY